MKKVKVVNGVLRWGQSGSHWGVYCVCAEAEESFRSICLEKGHLWGGCEAITNHGLQSWFCTNVDVPASGW